MKGGKEGSESVMCKIKIRVKGTIVAIDHRVRRMYLTLCTLLFRWGEPTTRDFPRSVW